MSGQAPGYPDGGGLYPPTIDHELMSEDNNNNNIEGVYHTSDYRYAPYNTHGTAPYYQQDYSNSPPSSVTPPGSVDPLPYYPRPTASTSVDVNLGEWEDNASSQTSEVPVEDHTQFQQQPSRDENPRVSITESFVQGRQNSFDKHEKFQKDPAKARKGRIESAGESCRKYDGSSKKKGAQGDGSGCKPTDKKHHRHDHHGGGGASGVGSSRAEAGRKESKGKGSKGKGKESSSKSR